MPRSISLLATAASLAFAWPCLASPPLADKEFDEAVSKTLIIQVQVDKDGVESQPQAMVSNANLVEDEATADVADASVQSPEAISLDQSDDTKAPAVIQEAFDSENAVADLSAGDSPEDARSAHWHVYRSTPYGGFYGYGAGRRYGYGYGFRRWSASWAPGSNLFLYNPGRSANYGVYYRGQLYPFGYSSYVRTTPTARRYYYYSPYRR
jgi:hypothetical protein